eukprot:scaffold7540_cov68-Phaeocystis_antarctica.AAC.2
MLITHKFPGAAPIYQLKPNATRAQRLVTSAGLAVSVQPRVTCHAAVSVQPSPAAVGVPLELALATTSLNSSAAALPMAISLNGQQFHGIKTNFSRVAG